MFTQYSQRPFCHQHCTLLFTCLRYVRTCELNESGPVSQDYNHPILRKKFYFPLFIGSLTHAVWSGQSVWWIGLLRDVACYSTTNIPVSKRCWGITNAQTDMVKRGQHATWPCPSQFPRKTSRETDTLKAYHSSWEGGGGGLLWQVIQNAWPVIPMIPDMLLLLGVKVYCLK